ncbi:MAG: hypothetical protein IPN76_18660 [Saprospiraceae bacterium]|nr:hypothetical protein [Saprospiraceae bacterium]
METFNEKTCQQFFYCELEGVEEDAAMPLASVRFQDVEDENISFHREFPLDFLRRHGVSNVNDRFKMIFFSETDNGMIGSHAIVPLPPNVKL